MRIDSNQIGQPVSEGGRTSNLAAQKGNTSVPGGVGGALGEDQAQVSDVHAQIQALVAQVSQLPEAKQEKVNALRQAVVEGSYQPKPAQVAEALFANMVKLAA
jgi:flagellar biosynthesis anti-sigma factor FlgM